MLTQTVALSLAAFACVMTLLWLLVEERVTFTSLLAFLSWGYLGLYSGDVEIVTDSGTVAAAFPDELRWIITALALLSALAGILYRIGHYPPDVARTDAEQATPDNV